MYIPVSELMQVQHRAYPLLRSRNVIPESSLPSFFDLCSRVLGEFISLASINQPNVMEQTDMYSTINDMIDTFQNLLENDEPEEFFTHKKHFEDYVLPDFKTLMDHLSRCVNKPESLRHFYHSLALKVEQAFEYYILGCE